MTTSPLIDCTNFIAGKWTPGHGVTSTITSPWTGAAIGTVHHSTREDLDAAVAADRVDEREDLVDRLRRQRVQTHLDGDAHVCSYQR